MFEMTEELKFHIENRYSECCKRSQGLSYGSFYDGYMDCYCEQQNQVEELEKENAELKADNDARKFAMAMSEKVEKQLRKENTELKQKVENQKSFLKRIKAKFNLGKLERKEIEEYLDGEQLTKAKEIMNIAIEGIKHWGVVGGTERPFEKQAEKLFNLFLDKAEQFLKEVEE